MVSTRCWRKLGKTIRRMTRSTCDGSVSGEIKRSSLELYWFTSRNISNHDCLLQRHWNGVKVHGFFMSLCFGSDWKLQSFDKHGWEISSHCTKWTGAFTSSFIGVRYLDDRRQEQNILWFLSSGWERKLLTANLYEAKITKHFWLYKWNKAFPLIQLFFVMWRMELGGSRPPPLSRVGAAS